MKRRIRVNPKAKIAYIPKDLIDQGFTGELDGYANAVTLTIVNPKTTLRDIERSLKIVLDDIKFRRQREESGLKEDEIANNHREAKHSTKAGYQKPTSQASRT